MCTKLEESLKRLGGVAVVATPGTNPGHHGPWQTLLAVLDRLIL